MEKKKWPFFKFANYLCLVLAILLFIGYLYIWRQYIGSSTNRPYVLFAYCMPLLQCILHIQNLRLLYHHLPKGLVPSSPFNVISYIATIIVALSIAIYTVISVVIFIETVRSSQTEDADLSNKLVICLFMFFSILNTYCLFAGRQLRKTLRMNHTNENEWLSQLGK